MPEAKRSGQRICLFGGTFDPIHQAHLRIAQAAAEKFHLDVVLFIPAGTPPHKASAQITPYEDRLRMVEIACQPFPQFEASDLEKGEGRSYTIDTVKRFRQSIAPESRLFFLIGADAFAEIETWKDWSELLQLIEFVVVTRPGQTYKVPEGATVHTLTGLELAVSSSKIRARLINGDSIQDVPAEVRAFIEARRLYRTAESSPTALQ